MKQLVLFPRPLEKTSASESWVVWPSLPLPWRCQGSQVIDEYREATLDRPGDW